jgi:hypothetical protein
MPLDQATGGGRASQNHKKRKNIKDVGMIDNRLT